jgi:hypothetical protein
MKTRKSVAAAASGSIFRRKRLRNRVAAGRLAQPASGVDDRACRNHKCARAGLVNPAPPMRPVHERRRERGRAPDAGLVSFLEASAACAVRLWNFAAFPPV